MGGEYSALLYLEDGHVLVGLQRDNGVIQLPVGGIPRVLKNYKGSINLRLEAEMGHQYSADVDAMKDWIRLVFFEY